MWLGVSHYSRKSSKVGIDGKCGRVELYLWIEDGDGGGYGPVSVRFIVGLIEEDVNILLLSPDPNEKGQGEDEGGESVEQRGLVVDHRLGKTGRERWREEEERREGDGGRKGGREGGKGIELSWYYISSLSTPVPPSLPPPLLLPSSLLPIFCPLSSPLPFSPSCFHPPSPPQVRTGLAEVERKAPPVV